MDSTVRDVRELWGEYIMGRNGLLPVEEMSQRPIFNGRRPIFLQLYQGHAYKKRGMSEGEAAALMEMFWAQKG